MCSLNLTIHFLPSVLSASFVVVLVYVDDLILGGSDYAEIQALKSCLHSAFSIKDLGNLSYFLGLEISRSTKDIFLC
jgi:histone deacetylase 1/2